MLVLAFSGLLWSTLREGTEYYKHVDEVMANPQAWEGKQLQLHGYVVPGSILRKPRHARIPVQGAEQPARAGDPATSSSVPTPASCPTRSRARPKSCSRASSTARRVPHRPERRHGEVSVEVRSRRTEGSAKARNGLPRIVSPARHLRRLQLRRGRLGGRRAAPLARG